MTAVLFLAPALLLGLILLALTLLARRYPGERALVRRAAAMRIRGRRRRTARTAAVKPGLAAALLPRGGSLLASPLAVRPPPAALLVS